MSTSFISRSSTTLVSVLVALSTTALAQTTNVYTLDTAYQGQTFFDGWDFFSGLDPTHGFVSYKDRPTSFTSGLAQADEKAAFMRVDAQNVYDPNSPYKAENGHGRPSVRIETKKSWKHGLFISKIDHMPGGQCGVWPAWWTLGAGSWPEAGEIDMIEGVSQRKQTLSALHTGSKSIITGSSSSMTGQLVSTNCEYDPATPMSAQGCVVMDQSTSSFGSGFNQNGGGVVAMEWTAEAIKIWAWPKGKAPADTESDNPNPRSWGLATQAFEGPDANLEANMKEQRMIIDTTFCGDFAGALWDSEGCAASTGVATCDEYVAKNPTAFADAYWQFANIKVFQLQAQDQPKPSPSPSPSTTSEQPAQPTPVQNQPSINTYVPPVQGQPKVTTTTTNKNNNSSSNNNNDNNNGGSKSTNHTNKNNDETNTNDADDTPPPCPHAHPGSSSTGREPTIHPSDERRDADSDIPATTPVTSSKMAKRSMRRGQRQYQDEQ